jgi:hypothetical protein
LPWKDKESRKNKINDQPILSGRFDPVHPSRLRAAFPFR